MCLEYAKPTDHTYGIGYKYVIKTEDPNVFTNEWMYFNPDGTGGLSNSEDLKEFKAINRVTTYTLMKETLAVQDVIVQCCMRLEEYPSGIHLCKEPHRGDLACLYTGAYVEDFDVIVAKRVVPLGIVDMNVYNNSKEEE